MGSGQQGFSSKREFDIRGGFQELLKSRRRRMRRILYIIYQPYKFLVYLPILVFSTLFLGTAAVVIATTISPKLASATCGVWWARLNAYITPMLVSVWGRERANKEQSYVIVSNHQSHYDVFVLYGWLGIDFKWVMKKELRKIPALGVACEKAGHIYIDRSNRETAIASLEEAKKRIVNGTSVLFFPEGTRSATGELQEFKKGAFIMALELGIPILPITILNTGNILPTQTINLFPGRATMLIHPPIDVSGYNKENLRELMAEVKKVIQEGLKSQ
jgi:1-acyl-sn-glycerol-3-phosphate acyltransferase